MALVWPYVKSEIKFNRPSFVRDVALKSRSERREARTAGWNNPLWHPSKLDESRWYYSLYPFPSGDSSRGQETIVFLVVCDCAFSGPDDLPNRVSACNDLCNNYVQSQ